MKKKILFILAIIMAFYYHKTSLIAEHKQHCFHISDKTLSSDEKIITNPNTLLDAAIYATHFFQGANSSTMVNSKNLEKVISSEEALETLQFIIESIKHNTLDILDPSFINKNFTFIKWDTDEEIEKDNNNIKLTHYAIYHYPGSEKQSEALSHALYGFPSNTFLDSFRFKYKITKMSDLKNLAVNDTFHNSTPFRFGKQNILNGALNTSEFSNHITPLVWVSRNTLERALYEGGIFIDLPNGQTKLFNVDHCNNIFYDRSIIDETGKVIDEDQERYWTFREVENNKKNFRDQRYHKLLSLGLAAFAHDKKELGLGKLIAVRFTNKLTNEKEVLIGVLADIGSAFVENLHQLDLYSGTFQTRESFNQSTEKFPLTVEAYILKKRIN